MACENAINATDVLRDEIRAQAEDGWDAIAGRAIFANTAVDRIVPAQAPGEGVDVLATVDGKDVVVRYGNQVALAFHPELDGDTIHRWFLENVVA